MTANGKPASRSIRASRTRPAARLARKNPTVLRNTCGRPRISNADVRIPRTARRPTRRPASAKTRPGLSSSKMCLSFAKSFDISEYAGEIGATGTPACIAPSASSAWSMLLSERDRKSTRLNSSHRT